MIDMDIVAKSGEFTEKEVKLVQELEKERYQILIETSQNPDLFMQQVQESEARVKNSMSPDDYKARQVVEARARINDHYFGRSVVRSHYIGIIFRVLLITGLITIPALVVIGIYWAGAVGLFH